MKMNWTWIYLMHVLSSSHESAWDLKTAFISKIHILQPEGREEKKKWKEGETE